MEDENLDDKVSQTTVPPGGSKMYIVVEGVDKNIEARLLPLQDEAVTRFESVEGDVLTNTGDVLSIKESISGNYYSVYGGNLDNVSLPQDIVLSSDGDFIEFVCVPMDLGDVTSPTGLGIVGHRGVTASNSQIGFLSNGAFSVRSETEGWITQNGFGENITASLTEEIRCKFSYEGGNMVVRRGGVITETIAGQKDFIFRDVGNAYRLNSVTYIGKIRDVVAQSSGVVYSLGNVIDYPGAVTSGATSELSPLGFLTEEQLALINTPASNKSMYYTYDADGYNSLYGKFTVFQEYPVKDGHYAGFDIIRRKDDSAFSDNWHLNGGRVYLFSNGIMTPTGKTLILDNTDNEGVYQLAGASDATGGKHGDEKFTDIKFFANDAQIESLSSDIPLTACDSFYYAQISETFTADDVAHPKEADRIKITRFEDVGYYTYSKFTFTLASNLATHFHGLSSIHNDVGSLIHNKGLTYVVPNGDDGFKMTTNSNEREYYASHAVNKMGAYATSRCIQPADADATATSQFRDRPFHSKYYRWNAFGLIAIGTELESEMTVKFYRGVTN